MAETGQDFNLWAGNSKTLTFTVSDVASLAGATAKWGLSLHTAINPALVSKSSTDATQITIDSTAASFAVVVNSTDTDSLSETQYYHEAEVTDAAGNVATVAIGDVTVYPTAL